jgi:hypothetical protein
LTTSVIDVTTCSPRSSRNQPHVPLVDVLADLHRQNPASSVAIYPFSSPASDVASPPAASPTMIIAVFHASYGASDPAARHQRPIARQQSSSPAAQLAG